MPEEKSLWRGKPVSKVLVEWFFTKILGGPLLFFIVLIFLVPDMIGFLFQEGLGLYLLGGIFGFLVLYLLYLFILKRTYEYEITDRGAYFTGGVM